NGVPIEIEEASRVDGCNRFQSLVRIIIPAVLPGIATCAIFSFIMDWNEFFYALILSGRDTQPVTISVHGYISSVGLVCGPISLAAILVILPVLIFTIFAKKCIVQGLTQGSSK